ncbi:Zn-dependent hydrolase [Alcaligenes faecalis]|uniref:Zn-dependent hydrolase n=1 Tax=Alcaligenes faecalis TaxID=511 RepID=A0A2U2BLY5_ALCFA|nr:Zn-dependent hydrolase [Alcaligenes faecalis]PWE15035.1 Zn-dependent hydrolase [Alcaligenes faecalis]
MSLAMPLLNQERLWRSTQELAAFTLPDQPWTRRAFSDLFLQSRQWLLQQFEEAGLSVRMDAAGNLIGRREGCKPGLAPITTGSHCDTVMYGGRYDGIIGVLAGLEVARCLNEQNIQLDHPFEVVDFLSEEPSDYGVSCVGSRAMGGVLSEAMLAERNPQGETLAQGIARIGGRPQELAQARRAPGDTAAFVELHIEQGPVLESRNLPIGVVSNIVGICRHRIIITGRPDHAGTTPMDIRRDALVGASLIISEVDRKARRALGGPDYLVATIGNLNLTPNASNAVPGRVEMMVEVRSDRQELMQNFTEELLTQLRPEIEAMGLGLDAAQVSLAKPTDCTPDVMNIIEQAASALGYQSMVMPSGAGHDAVYMAPSGPMGMIFIPCLNGRSHCPEESITSEQLLDGTRVLYQTVVMLDQSLES